MIIHKRLLGGLECEVTGTGGILPEGADMEQREEDGVGWGFLGMQGRRQGKELHPHVCGRDGNVPVKYVQAEVEDQGEVRMSAADRP